MFSWWHYFFTAETHIISWPVASRLFRTYVMVRLLPKWHDEHRINKQKHIQARTFSSYLQ